MATSVKYKFSGHQTFVFRYGWLEKGVRGVNECSTLFSEEDALVRLGVGKNMVDRRIHPSWRMDFTTNSLDERRWII